MLYLIIAFIISGIIFIIGCMLDDTCVEQAQEALRYINDRLEITEDELVLIKPNNTNFNEHCRENNIVFSSFEERESAYQKYCEKVNEINARMRRWNIWEKILPELKNKFGGNIEIWKYDITFMKMMKELEKEPKTRNGELTTFDEYYEMAYKMALTEWDFSEK